MRCGLLVLLLCSGCSSLLQPPTVNPPAQRPRPAAPPAAPLDHLRDLKEGLHEAARQLEERGDSRSALEKRRILAAISHDDSSLADSVRTVEEALRLEAEKIYREGLEHHRRGDFNAARRTYLAALQVDPNHEAALEELKNGLTGDYIIYRPREKEALASIARRVYGSVELADILAAVNGLDVSQSLPSGALVTIPRLDRALLAAMNVPSQAKAPASESRNLPTGRRDAYSQGDIPDVDTLLASARKLFNERLFREAIEKAGKIAGDDPLAPEAREIINGSYFNIGGLLADEGRLPLALEAYSHVDRTYRNVEETIGDLEKRMAEMAEEHYITGVKFFVSQQLGEAIAEWEKTLALNPAHEKAGEDIRKAKKLLEELQKVQEPDSTAPK